MIKKEIYHSKFVKTICPCCEEGIIEDDHDICLICGWEYDNVQNESLDFIGGANKDSLNIHRKRFLEKRKNNKNYCWSDTWQYEINYFFRNQCGGNTMKYSELYNGFIELFPEDLSVFKQYEEKMLVDISDGMHVLFGMIVVPYLIALLENNENKKLEIAFEYIEQMESSDDPMICEVVEFTVLEDLISRGTNILDKFKTYMGKETLESCYYIERFMS